MREKFEKAGKRVSAIRLRVAELMAGERHRPEPMPMPMPTESQLRAEAGRQIAERESRMKHEPVPFEEEEGSQPPPVYEGLQPSTPSPPVPAAGPRRPAVVAERVGAIIAGEGAREEAVAEVSEGAMHSGASTLACRELQTNSRWAGGLQVSLPGLSWAPARLRSYLLPEDLAKELQLPRVAVFLARLALLLATAVLQDLYDSAKTAVLGELDALGAGAARPGSTRPPRAGSRSTHPTPAQHPKK